MSSTTYAFVNDKGLIVSLCVAHASSFVEGELQGNGIRPYKLPPELETKSFCAAYFRGPRNWELLPPRPTEFHEWNGSAWEEDLVKHRNFYLGQISGTKNNALEKLTVAFAGAVFSGSQSTETDLTTAILLDQFPQEWQSRDMGPVVLDLVQAKALLQCIRDSKLSIRQEYWRLSLLLSEATKSSDFPLADIATYIESLKTE